jgi:chromosomal replication initiation ATPase DnaA
VRQVGMYVAHVTLALTMSEVGRAFGRDRSTVNHACHLVEDMREDLEFDRIIQTIENIIRVAYVESGRLRA